MKRRRRGIIKEKKKYSRNWIGRKFVTKRGEIAEVIDGGSKICYCTIKIKEWIKEVHCEHLRKGCVKSPYCPSIYRKGYIGTGKYKVTIKGKKTKSYTVWYDMLNRCYNTKCQSKHPTYIGCTVEGSWLCFQVFAKWYEENYQDLNGVKLELDKDLMVKGNKMYSPKTCKLIPKYANLFLANSTMYSKSNYTGVHWDGRIKKYQSQINDIISHKTIYLGCFSNEKDASNAYILERKNQSVKMYHKLIKDGFTDAEVLNKFKNGEI